MKQNILVNLTGAILLPCILGGCSPEKANAESPCPPRFNSAEISVIDSITNDPISTSTVVLAGEIYDESTDQSSDTEIIVDYDIDRGIYSLPYEIDGIEGDPSNLTIYTTDPSYHSNVSKTSHYDLGCTTLEYTIYLCPNGTACR